MSSNILQSIPRAPLVSKSKKTNVCISFSLGSAAKTNPEFSLPEIKKKKKKI